MKFNELLSFDKSQKSIQTFGLTLAGIVFAYGVYSAIIQHLDIQGIATLSIGIVLSSLFFQKPILVLYYPLMIIVQTMRLLYGALIITLKGKSN